MKLCQSWELWHSEFLQILVTRKRYCQVYTAQHHVAATRALPHIEKKFPTIINNLFTNA